MSILQFVSDHSLYTDIFAGTEPGYRSQRANDDLGLMEELTKLMFSADKRPVLVSNNPLVMATLTNYEKRVRIV